MLKQVMGWMSPAGAKARLSILIFHRVLPVPDPLFPDEMDARRFDELCAWLKRWFNVLPLDEAAARLRSGRLPARAACITFDDGYADNQTIALPILQRHGLASTFFIATGFLDGGRMWNDTVIESIRRTPLPVLKLDEVLGAGFARIPVATVADKQAAISAVIGGLKYQALAQRSASVERIAQAAAASLPGDLMMSSEQVRALHRAGMQIGAHTVSHPILARLDRSAALDEISRSKQVLEGLLGERVGLFAYPNGKPDVDYSAESVSLVESLGFDAAVSTHWAAADAATDPFQIPRFTPWDRRRIPFGLRLARNFRQQGARAGTSGAQA